MNIQGHLNLTLRCDCAILLSLSASLLFAPKVVIGYLLSPKSRHSLELSNITDNIDDDENLTLASIVTLLAPSLAVFSGLVALLLALASLGDGASYKGAVQSSIGAEIIARKRVCISIFFLLFGSMSLLSVSLLPYIAFDKGALLHALAVYVTIAVLNIGALFASFKPEINSPVDEGQRPVLEQAFLKEALLSNRSDEDRMERSDDYDHQASRNAVDPEKERGWSDLLNIAWPQRWWIAAASLTLAARLPFSLVSQIHHQKLAYFFHLVRS